MAKNLKCPVHHLPIKIICTLRLCGNSLLCDRCELESHSKNHKTYFKAPFEFLKYVCNIVTNKKKRSIDSKIPKYSLVSIIEEIKGYESFNQLKILIELLKEEVNIYEKKIKNNDANDPFYEFFKANEATYYKKYPKKPLVIIKELAKNDWDEMNRFQKQPYVLKTTRAKKGSLVQMDKNSIDLQDNKKKLIVIEDKDCLKKVKEVRVNMKNDQEKDKSNVLQLNKRDKSSNLYLKSSCFMMKNDSIKKNIDKKRLDSINLVERKKKKKGAQKKTATKFGELKTSPQFINDFHDDEKVHVNCKSDEDSLDDFVVNNKNSKEIIFDYKNAIKKSKKLYENYKTDSDEDKISEDSLADFVVDNKNSKGITLKNSKKIYVNYKMNADDNKITEDSLDDFVVDNKNSKGIIFDYKDAMKNSDEIDIDTCYIRKLSQHKINKNYMN